jgi:N12 class adenine-specific DNA methylase
MLAPLESNIIPLPHQILALEKVMSGQYLRFLLADEVGMGKTIEIGLVLRELYLSGQANKILLLVPASVLKQWQEEMSEQIGIEVY